MPTIEALRHIGTLHAEAFMLWGGVEDGADAFRFTTPIFPAQRSHKTDSGLLVTVDGEALFDVNRALYEHGEILGGQVHTHPTHAFHSDTDDHFPLVTLLGALSLVIPNFAAGSPGDIKSWAWYRLVGEASWKVIDDSTQVVIE